jgi:phosphatidylglycerophosphatase A
MTDIDSAAAPLPPRRASPAFLWRHPAHWIALGFGSGLSPWAPGTVGTLWAWLAFLVLQRWFGDVQWALAIGGGCLVGLWACTVTARHLRTADPSAVVWDEVIAFWLVLWLLWPAGFSQQLAAFALFRLFDAWKPGPVRWADRLVPHGAGGRISWRHGFGILFDDIVAAGLTLFVIALWQRVLA